MKRTKVNLKTFIERSVAVHGHFYGYSLISDVRSHQKVEIVCPTHGVFEQSSSKHMLGQGCVLCHLDSTRLGLSGFIRKANIKHSSKYDYSLAVYINSITPVRIICPVHGEFEQKPNSHLTGCGCPKCFIDRRWCTQQEFVDRSNAIHGYRYDYGKVAYKNMLTKVCIICKEHGEFCQTPFNHVNGVGCPLCAKSGYKKCKDSCFYIYVGDFVGFGITNDFKTRDAQHTLNFSKSNANMSLYKVYESSGENIQKLESLVKQKYKSRIINTGIDGFKTEALPRNLLGSLIRFINKIVSGLDTPHTEAV